MKKSVYIAFFIVLLVLVSSLFYLLYTGFFTPFTGVDKEASAQFKLQPVSKTNSFVGPVEEVLDVTFQHYFELSSEASFSQLGIYEVVVKSITKNKDVGYLVVTRDKKTLHLPLVGVLSLKHAADASYKRVNVRQLNDFVKIGDKLKVHLMYTSPLTALDSDQLRQGLRDQNKEKALSSEEMLVVEAISRTGLTENDILGMIYTNKTVKFRPSQLFVTLIEVEKK